MQVTRIDDKVVVILEDRKVTIPSSIEILNIEGKTVFTPFGMGNITLFNNKVIIMMMDGNKIYLE